MQFRRTGTLTGALIRLKDSARPPHLKKEDKMGRRKKEILPGFPKSAAFETREQVDQYLCQHRIMCLLCGHSFKALAPHLEKAHDMTVDDYREEYGLPYKRGLVCAESHDVRSDNARTRWRDEPERYRDYLARATAVQAEHGNPQRNKPHFWKRERTRYTQADYREFMRRVMLGRPLYDIQTDEDMPTLANVYWYMKRDAVFAVEWERVVGPLAIPGKKPSDKDWRGPIASGGTNETHQPRSTA